MSERKSIRIEAAGPSYLGWRGELLAELALTKVPGLIVYKPDLADAGYDFCVTTRDGFCFFVIVKTFSSIKQDMRTVASVNELRWYLDTKLVQQAHDSYNPVVLFLFDADTDHGRYLRLDTVPLVNSRTRTPVKLPRENVIDSQGLERLIKTLQETPRECHSNLHRSSMAEPRPE
jgi:hypothetical protein